MMTKSIAKKCAYKRPSLNPQVRNRLSGANTFRKGAQTRSHCLEAREAEARLNDKIMQFIHKNETTAFSCTIILINKVLHSIST